MPINITIPHVWQRVGRREWPHEIPAKTLGGFTGTDPILLVLSWPVTASYLEVKANLVGEEGSTFESDPDRCRMQLVESGIALERLPAGLERGRCHCLARIVRPDDTIALKFTIDTDATDFIDEAADLDSGGVTREIEVLAVATDGVVTREEVEVIYLYLDPSEPMRTFDGYAALDLGNTNSTLVCLDARLDGNADQVEVVNVEKAKDPAPVPSAVRITRFEPPPDDDVTLMETAESEIGRCALTPGKGALILGAKRILAEADPIAPYMVWDERQGYPVRRTLPAELFLAELFRAFHQERFEVPRHLAITHPTTFTPFEIEQLREAVVQGWRRSLAAERRTYKKLANPELPDLIIDEASAAAFYFLHRDYLDAPGGLNLLHYLYPEGLNLLVYDCGGGTTDIALVRAQVRRKQVSRSEVTQFLSIEVMGRTGHRDFGGDDITIAVFRVLKARLAAILGGVPKLNYPKMPEEADTLPGWLKKNERLIDEAVPTRFNAANLTLGDNQYRKRLSEALWHLAEAVKIALGGEESVKLHMFTSLVRRVIANLRECFARKGASVPEEESLSKALLVISVHRVEVDTLIQGLLGESIEYANHMIDAKLGDFDDSPTHPGPQGADTLVRPSEVHRVYIVGNASRYPLVQTMIRERLNVPFIDQRLSEVRGEDLKSSVAKGAALALQLCTRAGSMSIDFDRRLSHKLPFDITFRDNLAGGHRNLFREHQDYDELMERPLPVPQSAAADEDQKQKEVYLSRRWPGDSQPHPYLRFKFEEVIRGPLMVRYDIDQHRFVMRDDGTAGTEVVGVEIDRRDHVAPMQRGTL